MSLINPKRFTKNTGVSPVIAVILVVAVAVALSVSVGVLVLDIGQSTTSSTGGGQAGVTTSGDTFQLVDSGGADRIEIRDSDNNKVAELNSPGDSYSVSAEGDYTIVSISEDGDESVINRVSVGASSVDADFDTGGSITVTGS